MQRILRLLPLLIAMFTLAACGGEDAAKQDVDTLLKETFAGGKEVKSGKLDLKLKIDAKGGQTGLDGPITVDLKGPFESQGKAKLPKFQMEASLDGAGQSFRAGVTSTGDKGFVKWQGTDYAVSEQVFQQFRQGYEQAAKQGGKQDQSLQSLGLDPSKWLKNPKNEGESKVGDTDTVKITGDVDVPRLLDDINTALSKAGQLGLQGQGQLPSKLTDEQRKQVQEAVKSVDVEIHTGADDKILRRMTVAVDLAVPQESGGGTAAIAFDMSILDLNEGQDISAPENTKPFEELVGDLGPLLGNLGAGGAGGGANQTPGGSGSGSAGSQDAQNKKFEEYSQCVEQAGSDQAEAQKCADILTK